MPDKQYRAAYAVTGVGEVVEDPIVTVEEGHIASVEPAEEADIPDEAEDLGEVALAAGRVNAHSHAFQRAIRGRTEYLEAGRESDDFWSWREKMYRAALTFDPDQFEAVARFAFLEMARAGFTTVGEFHYVHHDPDGEPYAVPNELARRALRAARDVGLRISLLRVGYHRAGFEAEPNPRQRRFVEPDVETYLERVDDLLEVADGDDGISIGLAPHSIRAVPGGWLEAIAAFADERDLPVHIHASEQPGELDESRQEYGTTPIAAFDQLGLLSDRLTIVHATHATDAEIDRMAERGAAVCACPTTERNLGDGFLPARKLFSAGVPVCIGTDSHANIDPWEEMRLIEYHERLRTQRRNVLADTVEADADGRLQTARALWPTGGANGARALDLPPARLEPGDPADFVAIDLQNPAMAGSDTESLPSDLVFSCQNGAVADVFVGGDRIVAGGEHASSAAITKEFNAVLHS